VLSLLTFGLLARSGTHNQMARRHVIATLYILFHWRPSTSCS